MLVNTRPWRPYGSVGIPNRYGLHGPGIECRWDEIFRAVQTNREVYTVSCTMGTGKFDVHRAVHRNIISAVKPTRCTKVSNLSYFGTTLYMFRTVFPSIIRSSGLYIQQQAFVKLYRPSEKCSHSKIK